MITNDEIYFAIEDMFNSDNGIQYSFIFGDYYISLTSDCNDEECIYFNLCEKVDIFNEPMGEILYSECIYKYDMDNGLTFLDTWIKDCFKIVLAKELKTDFDYQTKSMDILDMIFSDRDCINDYEMGYSEDIEKITNKIECIKVNEIESEFNRSYFSYHWSNLFNTFMSLPLSIRDELIKEYSIKVEKDKFIIKQDCKGYWYLRLKN